MVVPVVLLLNDFITKIVLHTKLMFAMPMSTHLKKLFYQNHSVVKSPKRLQPWLHNNLEDKGKKEYDRFCLWSVGKAYLAHFAAIFECFCL